MTIKPVETIIAREIEGQLVLYDPKHDAVHTLNETAQLVWAHLNKPVPHIANILQNTYQVTPDVAQNDVQLILDQFQSLGLIQTSSKQ